MKALALVLALVSGWTLSTDVRACSEDGSEGFLPENELSIPVGVKAPNGGITQAQFNAIIEKVETIYSPVISAMGARLVIERLWANTKVNAFAKRDTPKVWTVQMFGGLARHSSITPDGFALVLCHEIGHHIGGAPKYRSLTTPWGSSEGQSDYFATLKCLRQVFLNDNNDQIVKTLAAPAALVSACRKSFTKGDVSICVRSGMAGASVASLFASMSNAKLADFSTPDTTVVAANFEKHPATQCRLDTYFQGAICDKSFNEEVSQRDEVQGTCHATTGSRTGLRPRCWHKPVVR